jgi:hypothetical protein
LKTFTFNGVNPSDPILDTPLLTPQPPSSSETEGLFKILPKSKNSSVLKKADDDKKVCTDIVLTPNSMLVDIVSEPLETLLFGSLGISGVGAILHS